MSHLKKIFKIETWQNRSATWSPYEEFSNRQKLYEFLIRTFAVNQYASEGKKREQYRDMGSYSRFCANLARHDYLRLYCEYRDGTHFFIKVYWSTVK